MKIKKVLQFSGVFNGPRLEICGYHAVAEKFVLRIIDQLHSSLFFAGFRLDSISIRMVM